jgi:hypothetical protein
VRNAPERPGDLRCWDCHRDVPHGTARSLSATPEVFRPRLGPINEAASAPRVGGRRAGAKKEKTDAQ